MRRINWKSEWRGEGGGGGRRGWGGKKKEEEVGDKLEKEKEKRNEDEVFGLSSSRPGWNSIIAIAFFLPKHEPRQKKTRGGPWEEKKQQEELRDQKRTRRCRYGVSHDVLRQG